MIFRKDVPFTPRLALAIALLYTISSDGRITPMEVNRLHTMMKNDDNIIKHANKYIKKAWKNGMDFSDFLIECNHILNYLQKEVIVLNMLDLFLANKAITSSEEKLADYVIEAFEIDKDEFVMYKKLLIKKNSHNLLDNK